MSRKLKSQTSFKPKPSRTVPRTLPRGEFRKLLEKRLIPIVVRFLYSEVQSRGRDFGIRKLTSESMREIRREYGVEKEYISEQSVKSQIIALDKLMKYSPFRPVRVRSQLKDVGIEWTEEYVEYRRSGEARDFSSTLINTDNGKLCQFCLGTSHRLVVHDRRGYAYVVCMNCLILPRYVFPCPDEDSLERLRRFGGIAQLGVTHYIIEDKVQECLELWKSRQRKH